MQLSNAPSKIVLPFAADGAKNTIPVPSQEGITPGAASYTDGFPPLTMTPVTSGGIPPFGQDFNGILNETSAVDLWMSAGAGFHFDAAFATAVGGYPIGARVLNAGNTGYWLCVLDNNSNNPDTGGAGWVPDGARASASVYASAQQSLAVGSSKVLFDTVEFDAQSLWNSGSKRFVANVAGRYRCSGAVYLAAPNGQDLAVQVFKNGTLAKQCFAAPQTTTSNLTMPYDAIITLAVGDYIETFMSVAQYAVEVGIVGSNQPYVYGQIEYLGV